MCGCGRGVGEGVIVGVINLMAPLDAGKKLLRCMVSGCVGGVGGGR